MAVVNHGTITGWQTDTQNVRITLNLRMFESGNLKARKRAIRTELLAGDNAGKVVGSGGQPRQSSSRRESWPDPELAIRWPALIMDTSGEQIGKSQENITYS